MKKSIWPQIHAFCVAINLMATYDTHIRERASRAGGRELPGKWTFQTCLVCATHFSFINRFFFLFAVNGRPFDGEQ